jgi:hypothetical protein
VTEDLAAWLLARYDEIEQVARAACKRGEEHGVVEHWQWVTTATDQPVPAHDLAEAMQHQCLSLSLRSVEEFPTRSVGPLPSFAIHEVEEAHIGALAHIAMHDPAAVLRDIAAKRAIVEFWSIAYRRPEDDPGPGFDRIRANARWTLLKLAQPFADRDDFREEWRA